MLARGGVFRVDAARSWQPWPASASRTISDSSRAGTRNDPRLRELIDELAAASQRFRELWARADVGYRKGIIHMRHPLVGDLHLHRNRLVVPHSGGRHLLIYYAEPGSESAKALEALRSRPDQGE
jgi:MmyB-like transcription regulator ligand binding domain